MLAVNVAGDSRARIRSFVRQGDLQQRFIVDGRRLARHFGVRATPTTIYLDAEGRVVDRQLGTHPIDTMRRKIEAILPER